MGRDWKAALITLGIFALAADAAVNESTPRQHRYIGTYGQLNATQAPTPTLPPPPRRSSQLDRHHEAHLIRSSVIFGLTKAANESNVNGACHTQMQQVQRGILSRQPWAMKVLDASGTKPSGFVFGQNYWLGSSAACKGVQRPVGITLSRNYDRVMHYGILTQSAPFEMDYRMIYMRHSSPWQVEIKLMSEQILHIGLCLPKACASEEVKQLAREYVADGSFIENDIFDMRPEVLYMKDLKLSNRFFQRASFKLMVASLLVTGALTLCAQQLRVAKRGDESNPGLAPVESELWQALETVLKWPPLQRLVSCYDMPSNWRKILATRDNSSGEIPIMNGLRSVCAFWILVFHVVWYMYFTVHNKTVLLSYAEKAFFQYVSSAPLLVDVFFTISGFLQTYNFLRNVKQMESVRRNGLFGNAKLLGKLLFHRYLRLGPLYLIVMASVDLAFAYMGDVSLYHINERYDELCTQHWWRNLLFIQNLFDHRELCVNWSWSLACDMQFFLVANLILFVYARHPKVAKLLTISGLLATITWSYGIGINNKFEFSFDATYATGTQIYTNPIVRVLPYIIGAIAAWCLLEPRFQVELSEQQTRWLWHFSLNVFIICIYATVRRDLGRLLTTSLFVLGRGIFSLSVCWMILGSATGTGVWWSRMLEAKCFQHLNRLSYAIYLVNPLVISFTYSLTSASTDADPFMLSVVSCGFTLIVYLVSIVLSLAFELPYSNLSSLLLRPSSRPKSA
ncbi:nose resistant to fluoxetine protein 6 [Drosophila guanche]|uniref:Blast:Nose resistant to fluoxetine protein 6 n=1 Tax=Drosophila guanche TaxID=7266 RepID=A0A3B0J6T7_DROGU|nr:nose resistant to fluoxetine protein 6 [Drosophila guanche]XP_034135015.1 nose resistant to fluoxetine protein 6 [Drosophila guanche]SPP75783.1 blast:Nose resistant to fluoxetine protein 6 [Drosophila guanche]